MRDGMLRRLGFALITALIVALFTLNVLAWSGGWIDEEPAPPQGQVRMPAPMPEAADEPSNEPISRETPERPRKPVTGIELVLTAARGECWVEARAGSPTGKTLYAGMLASGKSLRFSRPKIWLRLGAASNVDIEVNGRPSTVPSGTVELVLPTR
jgi:hypothetical protein